MTQTRELGNVKRKSRMLVSVNGMSGAIVKCGSLSFNAFLPAAAETQLRDAAVTASRIFYDSREV